MVPKYAKQIEYIRVDNNKIINMSCIKWVKKLDDCLAICTKGDGCYAGDTHPLCKVNNPKSYDRLNKHFE